MKPITTLAAAALVAGALIPQAASAGVFGTNPVNISVGPGGDAPDGPSGHPSISGDNRKGSLVAFDSGATNLVSGDGNGARDVFVWHRPSSTPGQQERLGDGRLEMVTQGANGDSSNPAVDGSLSRSPHCVAFESKATNLSGKDKSTDSDIYVRDLRSNKTTLVSDGVSGEATAPDIGGDCKTVAFQVSGSVYTASARGGKPKRLARGADPDIAIDGSAIAYSARGNIKLDTRTGGIVNVGRGSHPKTSGEDPNGWLVAYQGGGGLKHTTVKGGKKKSTSFPGSLVAGVTAFAATRGIVTYARGNTLFYLNLNSGNSDDLAVAQGSITEADSSARANFAALVATGGEDFVGPAGQPSIWFKSLPQ